MSWLPKALAKDQHCRVFAAVVSLPEHRASEGLCVLSDRSIETSRRAKESCDTCGAAVFSSSAPAAVTATPRPAQMPPENSA